MLLCAAVCCSVLLRAAALLLRAAALLLCAALVDVGVRPGICACVGSAGQVCS